MSNRERITQVAHKKGANEQIASFLSKSLIFSQKTSDSLKKLLSKFPALHTTCENQPDDAV